MPRINATWRGFWMSISSWHREGILHVENMMLVNNDRMLSSDWRRLWLSVRFLDMILIVMCNDLSRFIQIYPQCLGCFKIIRLCPLFWLNSWPLSNHDHRVNNCDIALQSFFQIFRQILWSNPPVTHFQNHSRRFYEGFIKFRQLKQYG